jgi:hypothetical protein
VGRESQQTSGPDGTNSSPGTDPHCRKLQVSHADYCQTFPSMVETKVGSSSNSPGSASKPSGGRHRVISSCLTCRRRKVKCDHVHPVCGSCMRGSHVCTWTDQIPASTATGRISKPTAGGTGKTGKGSDVQARLDRLEYLLERAVAGQGIKPSASVRSSVELDRKEAEALTPSSNSQTSHSGGGIASDGGDGTLLLNDGQSQFVSSLHFALLADEVSTAVCSPAFLTQWRMYVDHTEYKPLYFLQFFPHRCFPL